jgi:hypothetical protein
MVRLGIIKLAPRETKAASVLLEDGKLQYLTRQKREK